MEEGEGGYNMKLVSSNHTQRLDEMRYFDLNIESHENEFKNPPRFVGESNETTTFEPSFEKMADFNWGGEGSWSAAKTSNF